MQLELIRCANKRDPRECLNNAFDSIADADERIVFCQQMPTYRQCERNKRRFRNCLIPPNPPTARDIRTYGIFTLDPETDVNIVCFVNQGEVDQDQIIVLSHPEVQRYVIGVLFSLRNSTPWPSLQRNHPDGFFSALCSTRQVVSILLFVVLLNIVVIIGWMTTWKQFARPFLSFRTKQ